MAKHLRHGGSNIARTFQCKAWHHLSEGIPEAPSSTYAEEGTMLHDWMEKIVNTFDNEQDAIAFVEGEFKQSCG
jgi:hypothetical protein